jgi:hypothetical protein
MTLTKEEEREIDQQAEDIKATDRFNASCLLMVVYYIIVAVLIFYKGALGWYFLFGSITTALLLGKIKQLK